MRKLLCSATAFFLCFLSIGQTLETVAVKDLEIEGRVYNTSLKKDANGYRIEVCGNALYTHGR